MAVLTGAERPLRVRTEDGTWVGGKFAASSYAAGFPNELDLFLEEAWDVDQATGALVGDVGLGYPVYLGPGTIKRFEFLVEQAEEETDG